MVEKATIGRWVSKSDAPIQNVQIHLDAQFLAQIGQETADLDSSQIEVLDRSAVCDPLTIADLLDPETRS